MNEIFNSALKFVLEAEGGFSDNPNDYGGATNHGIIQSVYDAYCKAHGKPIKSVKYIPDSEVSDIYLKEYWEASGCDKLAPKMAIVMFDTSVNMGVSRAFNFLKNCNGSVDKYLALREGKYIEFAQDNATQKQFLQGWLNRLAHLKYFLATIK